MPENVRIRRARPEEAARLTERTVRSKSHWGYDAEFLADAATELQFQPSKFLPDFHVYLLESDDGMVRFYDLIPMDEEHIELHDLFIEPKHIGKGYGRQLWDYAVNLARELGFRALVLTADPNAEPFYQRQGAVRTGEKVSSVRPDRNLPLMEYRLRE